MVALDIPHVGDPEELFLLALTAAGVSSTIVALLALVFSLGSWLSLTRSAYGHARKMGVRVSGRSRSRRGGSFARSFLTLAVFVSQGLTLGLCYLGGNYISLVFDSPRWNALVSTLAANGTFTPGPALSTQHLTELVAVAQLIARFLRLDLISGSYVILATIFLVLSYPWSSAGGDRVDLAGKVVALPASVLLLIGGVSGVLYLLITLLSLIVYLLSVMAGVGPSFSSWGMTQLVTALPLIVGLAGCFLYYGACHLAVRASGLVVRAWSPTA